MARIRTVKPEFWTSEQIAECSPIARLMFIGLWNFCDDSGIHPDNAKRIKMEIFPGDDISAAEVANLVAELERARLVRRYEVNGEAYLQVTGWAKHQKIDTPNPKYPLPNGEIPKGGRRSIADHSPNDQRTPPDQSPPEGKGRESKGEDKEEGESVAVAPPAPAEPKPTPKPSLPAKQSSEPGFPDIPPALKREAKATRLPAGWQPSADLQAWAALDLPRLDWRRETENFRDYWLAAPGAKGLKLDWDATWRKWMRKSEESLPAARRFNDRQQSNDGGGVDWSRRVEDFRARNFWLTSWGAAPTDPGCQAPALILHQHGYRTEAA